MNDRDLLGALDGTASPARGPGDPGRPGCSRKGCRQDAAWRLEWNNPRIHAPERRKTWLACPEHRDWLADYLRSRGLLKDVLSLE
ncbi:MAG: hypothetical protein QJR09_09225 [Micrococcus sp.]|nr:hypothetical protein [Micrococcus sp.]